jgi:two-component system, chemotaxis family, response regulator Rcp1
MGDSVTSRVRDRGVLEATISSVADPVDILLVEDSPGDVRLTEEALREGRVANRLVVVGDGEEALAYLRREGRHADERQPGLVLLDLNLPRLDGREVLRIIKTDDELKRIPVVILTTSTADADLLAVYDMCGNCYIEKPVEYERFVDVVRSIKDFWLSVVRLPPRVA